MLYECVFLHFVLICTCVFTMMYLRAVEAGQQPLVSGAAIVYFTNLSQSVEVGVHSEVVGLAEACNNDLVLQVTLFVH